MLTRLIEVQPEAEGAVADTVVHLVQGDRLPALQFLFTLADGTLVDYGPGAGVLLQMRKPGAESLKIEAACVYVAETGAWQYVFAAGDTDTPGEFYANLLVTVEGREMVSEVFVVRIRAVIGVVAPAAAGAVPAVVAPALELRLQPEAEGAVADTVVYLARGDRLPYLIFVPVHHDGTEIALEDDAVVIFRLWARDGIAYRVNAECARLGDGRYLYALAAADTADAGEFYGHLVVESAAGLAYTSEVFVVRIRGRV